jgi:hypothetical protein
MIGQKYIALIGFCIPITDTRGRSALASYTLYFANIPEISFEKCSWLISFPSDRDKYSG